MQANLQTGMYCKENTSSKNKHLSLGIIAWVLCFLVYPQSQSNDILSNQFESIRHDESLNDSIKLIRFYALKTNADSSKRDKDSVYARILTAIASSELKINGNYSRAMMYRKEALQINTSGRRGTLKKDAVSSALYLAYDYEDLDILDKALDYYDTTFQLSRDFPDLTNRFLYSKLRRAYLLTKIGDYQKSIEESFEGSKHALQRKDSGYFFFFLNQKAQACYYLDQLDEALSDIDTILKYAPIEQYRFEVATALKTRALIDEKNNNRSGASLLFKKAIEERMRTRRHGQVADDYTDWGNFYHNTMQDDKNAALCYLNVLKYAQLAGDSLRLAKGFINISRINLDKRDLDKAAHYIIKAMQYLNLNPGDDILFNPSSKQLNTNGNKDPIIVLMSNKTLLLFELYKEHKDLKYLTSSIKTALLTDSVITRARHEQSGERSKLYWRDKTRELFANAMEACYLANDPGHAFYFMEKSRAVLLNDKLNELGASSQLAKADAKTEQDFKIDIAVEQQKLNEMAFNTLTYNQQKSKLFTIKDKFQHFTKALEKNYPNYYQYKYEDKVPGLNTLQKYLAGRKECFIHYFTNDTVAYALSITANSAKITRLEKDIFDYKQINSFLRFCSSKDSLNAFYPSFATLSNSLYKTLFQPLGIAAGRVVVCSDNFLLPFEALCSDTSGRQFLINDYTFSYTYSATYLLKDTRPSESKGNFIGFAPVSFQQNLGMVPLKNSAAALLKSSEHYSRTLLFTKRAATKNNFIKNIGDYTVANVFSHAGGDNSGSEPKLYMQDSLIHLSDLQLLQHPATRLVMLSACKTNVGRNAMGEGIYSLARGFASAGIPSVSATLWEADEDMIYQVSAKFNEYLSQGMNKDIALHKAKLDFLKSNSSTDKTLPYYWANIILIGNTEPLELYAGSNSWWWIAGAAVILVIVIAIIKKRRLYIGVW